MKANPGQSRGKGPRNAKKRSKRSLGRPYNSGATINPKPSAESKSAQSRDSLPIVGIGASAGGLEAFTRLLKNLPADTGMGFVLIQHLDPVHESALTKLLAKVTSMPVREATNKSLVQPNRVYVIPPNKSLLISDGILKLLPRKKSDGQHRPIDSFLQSLAEDQRERAISVILSGTASDGTLGCEAIKAEGGITFAQDESAKYESMPRSAVAAGCIDFVLSPEEIAQELARIAKHPYVVSKPPELIAPEEDAAAATAHEGDETPLPSRGHGAARAGAELARSDPVAKAGREREGGYKKVLILLRNHCGVDFSLYRSSTIQRRINRRMVLNKQHTLDDYTDFLHSNTKELDALYSDVLINVTRFFRNPQAFTVLKRKVFPKLLQRPGDEPLRCWVLGCSTGQEAYSIAMTFVEVVEKSPRMRKLQVFATDLNDALLDKARHGLYAKSLAEDVSAERLRRFFVEEEGGYRINKALREMVVFARQNLISDPPFSRMDLISCRNILIYLDQSLQKKALPTFHYALKPEGFLFLGASESIGGFTDLFKPVDKKIRIYSRKKAPTPAFHLPLKRERSEPSSEREKPKTPVPMEQGQGASNDFSAELNAQREADRITVNRFAPPGVLINAGLQILQFRGPTGAYLEPPTGKASFNVLKMAREGLMLPLRASINKAKRENKPARKENIRVNQNGKTRTVNLEVVPLKNLRERHFLILFEDSEKAEDFLAGEPSHDYRVPRPPGKKEASRLAHLERELAETRDYLQSVQEQHEAAHEELQASSEEVQSANEELQSINEELETSKEELESANEELMTVNEEMAHRNVELNRLNTDLMNLQTSTQLAIMLLGRDLTIRRFSLQAQKQFNLLATDIGRPISNLRHNLNLADLDGIAAEVITSIREHQLELQDKDGRWYLLRVRPYMTLDNRVDGAVLVLVDIDDLKRAEEVVATARDDAQNTVDTVRVPLLLLDKDLRVESANRSFYRTFRVAPADTLGHFIYDLGNRQWDIPRLRKLLERILPRKTTIEDYQIEHDFESIGPRVMLLSARQVRDSQRKTRRILVAIEDVTERSHGATLLQLQRDTLELLVQGTPLPQVLEAVVRAMEKQSKQKVMAAIHLLDETGTRFTLAVAPSLPESYCRATQGMDVNTMTGPCCVAVLTRERVIVTDVDADPQWREFTEFALPPGIRAGWSTPIVSSRGEIVGTFANYYDQPREPGAQDIAVVDVLTRTVALAIERTRARGDQARLAAIVESSDDAIISKDLQGVITTWNVGAEHLFGYTAAEAVGQPVTMLIPADHLDEEPEILARIKRGEVVNHYETVRRRKDGTLLDISLTVSPIRDASGAVTGASKVARDITERNQAEQALRESEERFRTLVSVITDVPWTTDASGAFVAPQTAWEAYTGQLWDEHRGFGWANALHPEDRERVKKTWERAITSRTLYESDGRLWHAPSQQWRQFVARATPLFKPDGSVSEWVGSCTDIEDRKRVEIERERLLNSEQQARREADMASRMKDEFLATVSHELRTPLNAMLGWAEMLRGRRLDQQTAAKGLETIARNARAQNQLIIDLLDVSRIISGQLRLESGMVDLMPIIEVAVDTVRPAAAAKGVELRLELDSAAGLVSGDSTRLQQIVWNLLTNAVRFTPREGQVTVRLNRENTKVAITVTDTGEGISAEFLPYIFDRFRQAESTTKRRHGGLGLGLSIVRQLVEAHGGTVRAASKGVGKGATFTVTFPLLAVLRDQSDVKSADAGQRSASSASSTILEGVRVLVIDDEADARELLTIILTRSGGEVKVAATVRAALEILDQWRPDVLVSDIGMAGEDGYDLIRVVRTRKPEGGGAIPALALTGYASAEDAARARRAGYQTHMSKPVTPGDLVATVVSLAAKGSASVKLNHTPSITEDDRGGG